MKNSCPFDTCINTNNTQPPAAHNATDKSPPRSSSQLLQQLALANEQVEPRAVAAASQRRDRRRRSAVPAQAPALVQPHPKNSATRPAQQRSVNHQTGRQRSVTKAHSP